MRDHLRRALRLAALLFILALVALVSFRRSVLPIPFRAPASTSQTDAPSATASETGRLDRHSDRLVAPLANTDASGSSGERSQIPLIDRNGVIVRKGDSLGFNTTGYGATLDESSVTVAGHMTEEIGRPTVRLSFREARIGDAPVIKGKPTPPVVGPDEQSFHYYRDGLEERYTIKPEGFEQDFILRELPEERGEITIVCDIWSNLNPPASGTAADRLAFTHDGKVLAVVEKAVAIDAAGRRLSLPLTYADGSISMQVPTAWVADAVLPITVDPIISLPTTVRLYAGGAGRGVAYNAARDLWLVVWSEPFGASAFNYDLYAQHVDADGQLSGSVITVGATSEGEYVPAVCYAPAPVDRYIVVWEDDPVDNSSWTDRKISGRVLNSDGSAFSGIFVVDDRASNADTAPDVAFDGTNFYVSFLSTPSPGNPTVAGKFVSSSGVPGTAADVSAAVAGNGAPRVAFTSGTYLIVWVRSWDIYARTMVPAGTFPTTEALVDPPEIENIMLGDVCAGGNKFLISWNYTNPPGGWRVRGRICNTSLVFDAAAFTIANVGQLQRDPRLAFSATANQWLAAYSDSLEGYDIYANRVSTAGVPSAQEPITKSLYLNAKTYGLAWNSVRNTMLIVFADRTSDSAPDTLYARRYTFATPPAVPTGLVANASDSKVTLSWNAVAGATNYVVKRSTAAGGPYEEVGGSTATTLVDPDLINGSPYYYVVSAVNDGGRSSDSTQASATPVAASVYNVLFVVGNATLTTADSAIRTRLINLGYTVVVKTGGSAVTGDATGKSLVIISSTVSPGGVNTKFRGVTVPVLVCEHDLYDDMGMTGAPSSEHGTQTGQQNVVIAASSHPIAAGLSGTVQVVTSNRTFTWGKPLASGVTIATLTSPNTSKSAIFAYEVGASMPALPPPSLAPARRVGFLLHDATAAGPLSTNGGALFDAAVRWAAGVPDAPTILTTPGKTSVKISWTPIPGATSYTVKRSTSPTGPFTAVVGATGLSANTFVDTTVAAGTIYYYIVVAANLGGFSVASLVVSALPKNAVPWNASGVIYGRPYLRHLGAVDSWSQADYTLEVKYDGLNGLEAPPPGHPVTVVWSLQAWKMGGLPPSAATANLSNQSPTGVRLTKTATEGSSLLKADITIRDPQTNVFALGQCYAEVKFTKRMVVFVNIRFPEDGTSGGDQLHRTARLGHDGLANKFFIENDPDLGTGPRDTARQQYASFVASNLQDYWKAAGIDLYVTANLWFRQEGTDISDASFNGNGDFMPGVPMGGGFAPSDALYELWDHRIGSTINLWLVRSIDPAMGVHGVTLSPLRKGSFRTTIAVDDNADWSNIAHEIGHAFGHHEVEKLSDVEIISHGFINNRFLVEPVGSIIPVKREFLMWSGFTGLGRTGTWLSQKHAIDARANAKGDKIDNAPGQDP